MADFKTHIATSTVLGFGYAGAAYFALDMPLPSCLLAAGLGSVSGMLPDIDSNSGVPLRESLALASAVVPMMLVDRLQQFGLGSELIVLVGAAVYVLVRFGGGALLKRFTVHRGMLHSIPAAVIFAEIAFLLASGSVAVRWFKAGAVALGYLAHLTLDELYSLRLRRGRLRLKKSLGTGLKLFGPKPWPNAIAYLGLFLLGLLVWNEPAWMARWARYREQIRAEGVMPGVDAEKMRQQLENLGLSPSRPPNTLGDQPRLSPGLSHPEERTATRTAFGFE